MTATNLDAAASFTFGIEGDETVSLDPRDPGNWSGNTVNDGTLIGTKYGISAPDLIAWLKPAPVTAATMAAMSKDTADAIYRSKYWAGVAGDTLPAGVDLSTVDMQYNAGAWGARLLQQVVGTEADGWIGPQTLAAVAKGLPPALSKASARAAMAVQAHLGVPADGVVGPVTLAAVKRAPTSIPLLAALADAQLAYYRSLGLFPVYGNGWTNRVWARLDAALKLTGAPA